MKSQSYDSFWQKIHQAAKDNGFPLRVMFELTYQCNFYCPHCYVPLSYRKYKEQKTKEVFSILEQLVDMGCFYLGFTGGEPFMRKDILKILGYARKKGFEVIIYTNGSFINEKMADRLACLQLNKIDITIPGMNKNTFERISGVKGSRDKVFKAIELLHKKGVNLGFKSCVLKENESEIKEIQDFAASLGALHRLDDMLSCRLDGSDEPYKYRGSVWENRKQTTEDRERIDFAECKLEMESQEPTTNDHISVTGSLFKCGVGESQVAITPQGELKPCLMIDRPRFNILESSLKDAWQRLKDFIVSINPDENYQCPICTLKPYCKWCPAKGWLYNRCFTSCEPESRQRAGFVSKMVERENRNVQKAKV